MRMVNARSEMLLIMYGLYYTKCIFKERLKGVLTIKAFNSASVHNSANCSELSRNVVADRCCDNGTSCM